MKIKFGVSLIFLAGLAGCSLLNFVSEKPAPIHSLFVGPKRVICVNPLRNNLCLQVKEKTGDAWELYKGEVMGLEFEEGYFYDLQVQADTKSKPAVDDPNIQWILYKMVSKIPEVELTVTPEDLLGTPWILEQFGDLLHPTRATGDAHPNLSFEKDGKVSGSSGCSRFTGTYSLDGDRMHIGSLAAMKNMCPTPDGMLEQEQNIFTTLQDAERYQMTTKRLQIFSKGDARILIFTK
jgi:heat shock protein HslJ